MTELFINNVSVDLGEDIQHSLNYAIADIREPEKRNTSYSKTITLVGSKETNKLFSHLFEVNVSVNSSGTTNFNPSFNPNLKASAIMYADNISVFVGFAQLVKINVLDNYEVTYEVVLYGKLGDIYLELGENELTELDFSEYNHVYNMTNIVNSWNVANVGNGYHYTMIDRGLNDTITWNVEHWQPSIWLRTYINKIFEYAGYTFDCDFFNTTFFKRLHMPFTGEGFKITPEVAAQRLFSAYQGASVNNIRASGMSGYTTWQINTETSDPNNVYNTSTYNWTVSANGTYSVFADVVSALRFVPSSPAYFKSTATSPLNSFVVYAELVVQNTSGIHIIDNQVVGGTGYLPGAALITGDTTFSSVTTNLATPQQGYYLRSGDIVFVRFKTWLYNGGTFSYSNFANSGGAVAGDVYLVTKAGSTFKNGIANYGYAEGETIIMNTALPTKVKMRDLLTSTLKMFNLYVEESRDEQRKLIISPRNDFYTSETVDWSDKLDLNTEIEIEPMGALDAKRYELSWDYDEDFFNKYYRDRYSKVYGNRVIDITNDFVSEVKETKVIWAATVPTSNSRSDRIMPTILASDGTSKQINAKPRLLYYGGTRACQQWYFLANGASTTYYQYPYSGHLDDPLNSTVDLNFGAVEELMYTAPFIIYTNNNVYNKYHKQFIDEITDKDSKIVSANFYLTPSDIFKLSFKRIYFFNNSHFRLNRIMDYNPSGDGLTRCEFIKTITATTFESSGTVYNGGVSQYEQFVEGNPTLMIGQPPMSNSLWSASIKGLGNNISPSARNIHVVGDYNTIGGKADGVFIANSSGNTIAGGLKNVTLINTSGVTVDEGEVIYLGNKKISNSIYDYLFNGSQTGANTSLTTLYTYNLPPNAISEVGDTIIVEACFTTASNTNSKTVRIVLVSSSTEVIGTQTTTSSNNTIAFESRITNVGGGTYSFVTKTFTSSGITNVTSNAYFVDFSSVVQILFQGQNGTASAGDITLYDSLVYILRKK